VVSDLGPSTIAVAVGCVGQGDSEVNDAKRPALGAAVVMEHWMRRPHSALKVQRIHRALMATNVMVVDTCQQGDVSS
jgi:hypothetical protein